jgi:hypothetical protein
MKPLHLALAVSAFTFCGCAAPADAPPAAETQPPSREKPIDLITHDDVEQLLRSRPREAQLLISYREIVGLQGQFQWHIGDTHWWVRLHGTPAEYFDMDKLDKTKTYRVTGIVVDQNYGVIEVWTSRLGPAE